MKSLCAVALGIFVPAALLFAATGAGARSASAVTCTASASGTNYTLHIAIPAGLQQFGFAFGVPGATVTNAVIPGANGNFSTQNLAPNTSGRWISDTPLTGAPVVTLTTSVAGTGSPTVVPSTQTSYTRPVACALTGTPASRAVAITVEKPIRYVAASHAWHVVVAVPSAGTVSAVQLEPTIGTAGAHSVTAKSLVQARKITRSGAGKATLTLRPTQHGQAVLAANGSLKVELHVTFDAAGGKSGSEMLSLRLTK
jgi:hypothetical protein